VGGTRGRRENSIRRQGGEKNTLLSLMIGEEGTSLKMRLKGRGRCDSLLNTAGPGRVSRRRGDTGGYDLKRTEQVRVDDKQLNFQGGAGPKNEGNGKISASMESFRKG